MPWREGTAKVYGSSGINPMLNPAKAELLEADALEGITQAGRSADRPLRRDEELEGSASDDSIEAGAGADTVDGGAGAFEGPRCVHARPVAEFRHSSP